MYCFITFFTSVKIRICYHIYYLSVKINDAIEDQYDVLQPKKHDRAHLMSKAHKIPNDKICLHKSKKTATWIWHFIILTLGRLSSDIIKLVFLDLLLVIDLQLGENVRNLIQHTPKVMFFLNYRSPSSYCMKFIKGICKPWVLRSAKGLYYVMQSNRMSHLSLSF